MLAINDPQLVSRAEILWEKGTNRSDFSRGVVSKYEWVDTGSSFLPSEIIAAYLYAQIEHLQDIQSRRKEIWNMYNSGLSSWSKANGVSLPVLPSFATNNAHMFYIICKDGAQRSRLIEHLKEGGVWAVSHYLSLHRSPFYKGLDRGADLANSDHYTDCLLRLPLYYELTNDETRKIIDRICAFS